MSSAGELLIVLTNDDGIAAAGIKTLAGELQQLGEVVVVAPETVRNAASRSFSLDRPIRIQEQEPGWYAVEGTPVDCVYLALHHVLGDRKPDVVLSGINHGPNLAQDVTYSGTVGAAMEACDNGIPSAAISLAQRGGAMSFEHAARFVRKVVVPLLLQRRLPQRVLLNVNVPGLSAAVPADGELDWRYTRLGRHHYLPAVMPVENPRGSPFYWLGGSFGHVEEIADSDCAAVAEGLASLTPLGMDLTHWPTFAALGASIAQPEPLSSTAAAADRPECSGSIAPPEEPPPQGE